MFERAQSESIGVVLLTAVVALTVTGTGAVVLTEWQGDIDQGPIADLESEMTPINVTLDHRGGDTLYPNETTIRLVGVDEELSLDEPLGPGTSRSEAFDFIEGDVELMVIHDPTDTVVHSETYQINPTIDELAFEIANRSRPGYVIEDIPANYTVDEVFEVGVTRSATDEANLSVEDSSKLSVDEGASTITGTEAGAEVNATAAVGDETTETEIIVLENPPVLDVETHDASTTGPTSIEAKGELSDLGRLPEVDLLFETTPYRAFNKDADNNGDNVTSDGGWRTAPDGYAHGGDYVHDNNPLVPGETRTYYYNNSADIGGRYLWHLRDGPADPGYMYNEYYRGGEYWKDWPHGEFRIEVTLSEDGSTVDVIAYEDATGDDVHDSQTGVSTRSGDVYFTTHTVGTSGPDSIRLTDIYEPSKAELTEVKTDVSGETNYSSEITGLNPDQTYSVHAYAEEQIGGETVTATGDRLTNSTESQTVETVDAPPAGGTRINATGRLVDLGSLDTTDLLFEYTPHRLFNKDSEDNGDNVTAVGEWRTDPAGYTHAGRQINDNTPLVPGETRTYYYNNPANLEGRFLWYLRDDEDYGYVRNEYYRGGWYYEEWPDGDLRIEVTLSEDSSTVDVITYTDATGDDIYRDAIDVSTRSGDVYFSTYGGATSGENSIRLTDIYDTAETELEPVEWDVTTPTSYDRNITGLRPGRNYSVRAYAEEVVNGTDIVDTGERHTTYINGPSVTTRRANATGGTSIEAEGELLDIGDLRQTDLWFEATPYRVFNEDRGDNGDNVTAYGEWRTDPAGYTHAGRHVNDNEPLVAGETRTYYYSNPANLDGTFLWYLRDDEDFGYVRNDYYRGGYYWGDWPNGEYRIEVTLSEDGSTVDVVTYSDATGDNIYHDETDLSTPSGDVYFSTYGGGTSGENSIRLTDIYEPSESERYEVETNVTASTNYSMEIGNLDPDRKYAIRAYSERTADGVTITDSGAEVTAETESATVETLSAVPNGNRIDAEGELVDLGTLQETDLSFEYTPYREFNNDSEDNDDNVTAYGEWRTDPAGYTHAGRHVNDNRPLVAGETRTYYYDNPANLDGTFLWYLRDDEDFGYVSNDYYRGGYYWGDWPSGEYRIEVTLSEDGSTVDVITYSDVTGDDVYHEETDLSTPSGDVYFSTYGGGTSGENSIRLTDIYERSETETVDVEAGVTENTTYSADILAEFERNYTVRAVAEREVDNTTIVNTGDKIEVATESPGGP